VVIRTDHTMAKGKRTIGQVMIYKTLHRKLKIEQHEPQIMWEKQKHTKSRYNKNIYFFLFASSEVV
jgi:hypothetical protein